MEREDWQRQRLLVTRTPSESSPRRTASLHMYRPPARNRWKADKYSIPLLVRCQLQFTTFIGLRVEAARDMGGREKSVMAQGKSVRTNVEEKTRTVSYLRTGRRNPLSNGSAPRTNVSSRIQMSVWHRRKCQGGKLLQLQLEEFTRIYKL